MFADRLIVLNQTTLDSLKETEEKKIVKKFTEIAIKILRADFGFVWIKKPYSKNLELAYKSSSTPYQPTRPRKTGTTYTVLRQKSPLLIRGISGNASVRSFARKYLISLAIIPITYKNHTYGNMYICFKQEQKFSKDDQALCGAIGNNAAQALTISRLHHNLQDIKHTLDNTPQPKLIFDPTTRRISYFNRSTVRQTGLLHAQLLNANINKIIHPSSHKLFDKRLKHIVNEKVPSSLFEVALVARNNRKVPTEILLQYVRLPGSNPHLLAIFQDLRERKKNEEQIKHAAFHDTLTGLPNRLMFTNRLNTLLSESTTRNRLFGVIFVDLDRFKLVNDTVGHLVGDSLLKAVALRLKIGRAHV